MEAKAAPLLEFGEAAQPSTSTPAEVEVTMGAPAVKTTDSNGDPAIWRWDVTANGEYCGKYLAMFFVASSGGNLSNIGPESEFTCADPPCSFP